MLFKVNIANEPIQKYKPQNNPRQYSSYNRPKTLISDKFELNSSNPIVTNKIQPKNIDKVINNLKKLKSNIQGNIIVVSGPSGVGKDTLIDAFIKKNPEINTVISNTTRKPRPGEKDGVNFHFIDKESFEKLIKEDELFQYMKFNDNYYGTTKKELNKKRQGHDVVINVTADEALKIKEKYKDKAVLIFIAPTSLKELEKRLRDRGTEKEEEIQKRLQAGREQLAISDQFDYKIINKTNKVDEAALELTKHASKEKDIYLKSLEKLIALLEKTATKPNTLKKTA